MLEKFGEAGLVTVGKVVDAWRSGVADSYVDYTRPSRVEPNLIVDSSVLFNENTSTVTQSLHSAFSAYYLLAWNMLTVSIDNVAVARHLDKLNPNRSVKDSVVDTAGAIWSISNEGFKHRLPRFGNPSNEARSVEENDIMEPGGLAARSTEVIKEASNLSVGKLLEVQISSGANKQTLPIMIRLNANTMVPGLLAEFLATGHADNSAGSRWIKYQSGQINLIDLLTARDLVKEHKKRLMDDKNGLYTALTNQRRSNKFAGFLSLNPSVANATNLVVTSAETIKKVELLMNDKFSNFKARQRLFDETGLFIVAVMDTEYDRVQFYTTGIPSVSDLSIRECKASNQKEGASITDILKAYQLGNAPSF
ncbi:hypothetical protein [Ralstonia phage RSF1]|uniref:Virion structural protein n=1 Tax=Ralstonia phage RSF1 TaxID=1689679 RepID=A0A0K2QQV2_9CAUD|nr:hypothetical protein AVU11_gp183 [Ralstonia phage RSF1]BAS04975.1 hypothetical protein [Ralstonia phage RSF1]